MTRYSTPRGRGRWDVRMHGRRTRARMACGAAALAFCVGFACTPKVIVKLERVPWSVAARDYAAFDSTMVFKEIARLQKLVDSASDSCRATPASLADSSMCKREVLSRLFELTVHWHNPHPDYHRACALAGMLRSSYPDSESYYSNWWYALAGLAETMDRMDSLELAMQDASKSGQSRRNSDWKNRHALDSLSAVIKEQNATIAKQRETLDGLKKLEMRMEEQRRKNQ